jgi:hypothetical protein
MIGTAARTLAGTCLFGTLLVAGGHTIYYLYYWEWVRAQIAATFTVAGLVIGATWLILYRLDRLERAVLRLATRPEPSRSTPEPRSSGPRAEAEPAGRLEFPWLAPSFAPARHRILLPLALVAGGMPVVHEPELGVFIPVLLGAGLLASVVAAVIERTATAVNGRNGAAVNGSNGTAGNGRADAAVKKIGRKGNSFPALAGFVTAVLVVPGLWWTAHYSSPTWHEGRTEMTVEVASHSGRPVPVAEVLDVTARYCALNAITGVRVERVRPDPAEAATVVLTPVLDEQARRRFRGCLEDGTLFRYRMTVTGTVAVDGGR